MVFLSTFRFSALAIAEIFLIGLCGFALAKKGIISAEGLKVLSRLVVELTLPALIFVGVSPVSANATGTAALLPGYIASAWRFRRDVEFPVNLTFSVITVIALLGGCVGASILLMTSERLFSALIPWLLLLATAAFIIGPWLQKNRKSAAASEHQGAANYKAFNAGLTLFVICVYGGYFNGGLGIILLAALGLMGQTNLNGMNGLKNVISALLTVVAVAVYAAGDTISGDHLILLGIMAVLGGYFGAAFSYRISQNGLRWFIVLVGCLMSIGFFVR